ncbi:MAG: hypothetical protein WCG52_09855 [bacterium]
MNNLQPIAPTTSPVWPEVNATTAKNSMSTPQVGASEVPVRDSVISAGKTNLPAKPPVTDTVNAPYRKLVREWQGASLEVRSGEVKKGIEWYSDPSYPPLNVVNGIATMMVGDFLNNSGENLNKQLMP